MKKYEIPVGQNGNRIAKLILYESHPTLVKTYTDFSNTDCRLVEYQKKMNPSHKTSHFYFEYQIFEGDMLIAFFDFIDLFYMNDSRFSSFKSILEAYFEPSAQFIRSKPKRKKKASEVNDGTAVNDKNIDGVSVNLKGNDAVLNVFFKDGCKSKNKYLNDAIEYILQYGTRLDYFKWIAPIPHYNMPTDDDTELSGCLWSRNCMETNYDRRGYYKLSHDAVLLDMCFCDDDKKKRKVHNTTTDARNFVSMTKSEERKPVQKKAVEPKKAAVDKKPVESK